MQSHGRLRALLVAALLAPSRVAAQDTATSSPSPSASLASRSVTGSRTALATDSPTRSVIPSASAVSPTTTASPSPVCGVGLSSALPAASCLDAFTTCGLTNTTLWIRPNATAPAYRARCAFDGWTLAMKVDGGSTTLQYQSPFWTDSVLLNSDVDAVEVALEAKLQPFVDLPGRAIRLVFTPPRSVAEAGQPVDVPVGSFSSLRALFSGPYRQSTVAPDGWFSAFAGGVSHQVHCNLQGVNVVPSAGNWAVIEMRLGIVTNENSPTDCSTPDAYFGVGARIRMPNGNPWGGSAPASAVLAFSHGQFIGCASCGVVAGASTAIVPASVMLYVRDAVVTASGTPSLTPSPSVSASAGASPTSTPSGSQSASVTASNSPTGSFTPSAPPSSTSNREREDWTCAVGGSRAYYTQLDAAAGAVVAETFFLPHQPANWPTSVSADVLGCPLAAGARSASSFGSVKFFMLPLGYPSEGASIRLDLSGSAMAYAVYLGRGCPADPAAFQCLAWTRLPCFTAGCVEGSAVTYTFTAADAGTARFYVALTNTDHRVGSGGFSWRTRGKFLPEGALAYAPPAAPPSPTPSPGDGGLQPLPPVMDMGGALYAFGPGAGDASLGRSDDGVARLALPLPAPVFSSYVDAAFVSVNGLVSLGGPPEGALTPPSDLPRAAGQPAVIAALWADADTRGGVQATRAGTVQPNRVYCRVVSRRAAGATVSADSVALDRATAEVRALFTAGEGSFAAQAAVVATWYDVAPWPAAQGQAAGGGNTFQAVVATDGVRTFALLRYAAVGWTSSPSRNATGPVADAPAAALIDGGTGRGGVVLASAAGVHGLVNGSNVGVPGLWAHRIDTAAANTGGGCAETPGEVARFATLSPRVSSQLGGTPVFVSGPCFSGPSVRCRFGPTAEVDGRVVSPMLAVCVVPFQSAAGPVEVAVSVGAAPAGRRLVPGAGGGGAFSQWFAVGTFTTVRPDAPALPAVTTRNIGSAGPGACAGTGPGGKALPGLTAANDTTQLAWFAPADVAGKLKREGRLRWTVEAWELRYGGGGAVCPPGAGGGAARRLGGVALRRGLQSTTVGRGAPTPVLVAGPWVLPTVDAGGSASGAHAWLTPDLPPDLAGYAAPSRVLLTAHVPAPAFDDGCVHAVWWRVRLGDATGPAGGDGLATSFGEASLNSGLALVLGARASGGDYAKSSAGLCTAASTLVPPTASTGATSGMLACPLDARTARDRPAEWAPDPACGPEPNALTRAADALSHALPDIAAGLWVNRTLPLALAPAWNESVIVQARRLLTPHLQPCLLHRARPARGERSAAACLRSSRATSDGVSARCCYGADEQLITQGPGAGLNLGGGPVDAAWLTGALWYDVAKLLCCGAACGVPEGQCDAFAREHPTSRNGDGGHTRGGAWNDPHWTTLGGAAYTYNGRGAHLLVGLPLGAAAVAQASAEPVAFGQRLLQDGGLSTASTWQVWAQLDALPASATAPPLFPEAAAQFNCSGADGGGGPTVMRAVAARAGGGGSLAEVRLAGKAAGGGAGGQLEVLVDGQPATGLARPAITSQLPAGDSAGVAPAPLVLDGGSLEVSLAADGQEVTLAWLDAGVALRVTPLVAPGSAASGSMLQVAVSLSAQHSASPSFGLLGRAPSAPADVFVAADGAALPADSSERRVWRDFGRSWATAASPFAGGASGSDEDPEPQPPTFGDELLAALQAADAAASPPGAYAFRLAAACGQPPPAGGDLFPYTACVFDAVCTGDLAVGRGTLRVAQEDAALRRAMQPRPAFDAHAGELPAAAGGRLSYRFRASLPPAAGDGSNSSGLVRFSLEDRPAGSPLADATIDPTTGELVVPAVNVSAFGQLLRVFATPATGGGGVPASTEVYIVPAQEGRAGAALGVGAVGGIAAAGVALLAMVGVAALVVHRRRRLTARAAGVVKAAPAAAADDAPSPSAAPESSFVNPMGRQHRAAQRAAPKPGLVRAGSSSFLGGSLRNLAGAALPRWGSRRAQAFAPVATGPAAK